MKKRMRNILGMALTGQTLQLAEIRHAAGTTTVLRQGSFCVEGGTLLHRPNETGAALGNYLRQHGFAARDVVVGLPALHVITRVKNLPMVADESTRQSMIRLAIERDYPGRTGEWTFDYATLVDGGVTLAATHSSLLTQLAELLTSARLRPVCVMPTTFAVAAIRQNTADACLHVSPAGIELLAQRAGESVGLTHLPSQYNDLHNSDAAERLAATVSRAMAAYGSGAEETLPRCCIIPDAAADSGTLRQIETAMTSRFAVEVVDSVAGAVALASSDISPSIRQIDLLHHKLTPPRASRLPNAGRLAVIVASVLMLIVAAAGYKWYSARSALMQLNNSYAAIADEAHMLQEVRDNIAAVDSWFNSRPPYLDCLASLTHAFPQTGRIWVTNLTLDASLIGSVQCRAASKDLMLEYLRAMQASPLLDQIQLRDWSEAQRGSAVVSFEITFAYIGSSKGRR